MSAMHFAQYRETLQADRRLLLDRFQLVDAALKVVGVGSVGTYCAILLLMASEDDPLFLQVKQARPSVLEAYAGGEPARESGRADRPWLPHDAIGQRHLSRLGGRRGRPAFLHPSAPGHEDQTDGGGLHSRRHAGIRGALRLGVGAGPCTFGRANQDQWLPGKERQLRQSHRRLLDRRMPTKPSAITKFSGRRCVPASWKL